MPSEEPRAPTTRFERDRVSIFALTEKGLTIHICDDGKYTRCGRPVDCMADADDVLWFGVCKKCSGDQPLNRRQ